MIIIFDIETCKPVPPKDPADVLHGIQYCKGWTDYCGMGIGLFGAIVLDSDLEQTRSQIIDGTSRAGLHEIGDLLNSADHVIGFNSSSFDLKLLEAHGIWLGADVRHHDLLVLIREALKLRDVSLKGRSYSLESMMRANIQREKPMSGAMVPVMLQRGNVQAAREYLQSDIEATRDIALLEQLIDPNDAVKFSIRKPWVRS
jgi:hypothetical protein